MSGRQRRRNQSDWILTLQRSKRIRKLRIQAAVKPFQIDHKTSDQPNFGSRIPALDEDSEYLSNDQERTFHNSEEFSSFQPFFDDDCYASAANINSKHEADKEYQSLSMYTEEEELLESAPMDRSRSLDISRVRTSKGGETQVAPVDIEFLRKMRRKWENHLSLSGVIAVLGSVRYTVDQYEYTRDVLAGESSQPNLTWPPYSRAHDHFQDILKFCMPHNKLVELPRKCSENNMEEVGSNELGGDTEKVRIFFPSAWAKLDISSPSIFESIQKETESQLRDCTGLENSRIVTDRRSVMGAKEHLFVERGFDSLACGPGSILKVTISSHPHDFNFPNSYDFSSHRETTVFNATVVATWCVGTIGKPNMSFHRALGNSNLSVKQIDIIKAMKTGCPRPSSPDHVHDGVLPVDLCSLLHSDQQSGFQNFEAVLIHKFWRYAVGIPSKFIIWVRVAKQHYSATPTMVVHTANNDGDTYPVQVLEKVQSHVVSSIGLRRLESQPVNSISSGSQASNTLVDGTVLFDIQ